MQIPLGCNAGSIGSMRSQSPLSSVDRFLLDWRRTYLQLPRKFPVIRSNPTCLKWEINSWPFRRGVIIPPRLLRGTWSKHSFPPRQRPSSLQNQHPSSSSRARWTRTYRHLAIRNRGPLYSISWNTENLPSGNPNSSYSKNRCQPLSERPDIHQNVSSL